jgi:hypothetical protein
MRDVFLFPQNLKGLTPDHVNQDKTFKVCSCLAIKKGLTIVRPFMR